MAKYLEIVVFSYCYMLNVAIEKIKKVGGIKVSWLMCLRKFCKIQ